MAGKKRLTTRGHLIAYALIIFVVLVGAFFFLTKLNAHIIPPENGGETMGTAIDSLNGVKVYYNGDLDHVAGNNITPDGYNTGLKWQCVEFVKRYYYEYFGYVMPDAAGNAKDFFDPTLPDASYNARRALVQYKNPSLKKPAVNDIIVFDGHLGNKYGHIAIISKVYDDKIEIIQQNPGPSEPSREEITMDFRNGRWKLNSRRALGWMRIE